MSYTKKINRTFNEHMFLTSVFEIAEVEDALISCAKLYSFLLNLATPLDGSKYIQTCRVNLSSLIYSV
jgi:hypothetical protein